jgi:hypothetical protein
MASWRRRLLRVMAMPLLFLAMFSIAGGHWAVLQAVAWARMLEEYSRGASLQVAIVKTFSGKFPCGLCRKIKEGSQKQDTPRAIKLDKKSESFLCAEDPIAQLILPRNFSYPASEHRALSVLPGAPPSPPPRASCS